MNAHRSAAFRGALAGPQALGHGRWLLAGADRACGEPLRIYVGGSAAPPVAAAATAAMADAELWQVGATQWELRDASTTLAFTAGALQLHRAPAQAFEAALPPAAVPWRMRLAWWLLLAFLRIPGAARLLPQPRDAA
jgi:hypothetical protein